MVLYMYMYIVNCLIHCYKLVPSGIVCIQEDWCSKLLAKVCWAAVSHAASQWQLVLDMEVFDHHLSLIFSLIYLLSDCVSMIDISIYWLSNRFSFVIISFVIIPFSFNQNNSLTYPHQLYADNNNTNNNDMMLLYPSVIVLQNMRDLCLSVSK